MATFSFEEAVGQPVEGEVEKPAIKPFVPAKRTAARQERLSSAPVGADHISNLRALGSRYEGTKVTSLKRSVADNKRVGGKKNSQHLRGTAGDFVVPPKHKAAFIEDAESQGYMVIDEGDHLHVQLSRGTKKKAATPESVSPPVTGSSDAGPKQQVGSKFSFEDAWGGKAPTEPAATSTQEVTEEPKGLDFIIEGVKNAGNIAADKAQGAWDYISQRITDRPDQFLGQQITTQERTPQELDRLMKEEKEGWDRFLPDAQIPLPSWLQNMKEEEIAGRKNSQRFVKVVDESGKPAHAAQEEKAGFWANIKNPMQLLTEDSLPANIIEHIANAPAAEGRKFLKARQAMKEEQIVAEPHKYSSTQVEAAKTAVAERRKQQGAGVADMWSDLKKAATEDPGKFGAMLANSILADPEMILAPQGMGIKVVAAAKATMTGRAAGKAAAIADKVIDAGTTSAALNMGIGMGNADSEGVEYTGAQAKMDAGLGFVLGGTLGTIFGRNTKAKAKVSEGNISADTLDSILRDAAKEELAGEDIVRSTSPINQAVKHQIEEATGVKFESDADLKTYIQTSRKEWKQLFAERDLNGQYQKALADERMARRSQLAEEAAQREAAGVADEAKRSSVEAAYAERQSQRTARLAQEYDEAIKAREAAKQGEVDEAFSREQQLREVTRQLDEQEIFEAAFEGDVPAIRSAMQRAARRDSQLARPKWQRGSVDERVLMRLGAASLFAGTAFAVAPEEHKQKTAFAAALTGFMLPGIGGNVRTLGRKMRQAGMISSEGDIVGLLASEGKLKPTRTVEEIKARDADLVDRVKQGDQQAFKTIFDEYYPEVKRFVRNLTRDSGPRLGIDADDIAQDAFFKAYQNINQFRGDAKLSTWIKGIARNEGLQAIRQAKNLREGGEFIFESPEMSGVRDAYGESYSRDAFDEGAGAHMEDTPETQASRQEVEQQLIHAIEKLPEHYRKPFILSKIEQYDGNEVADILGISREAAFKQIQRAQEMVAESLAKEYGAKRSNVKRLDIADAPTTTGYRVVDKSLGEGEATRGGSTEGTGIYVFNSLDDATKYYNSIGGEQNPNIVIRRTKYTNPRKTLVIEPGSNYEVDYTEGPQPSDSAWDTYRRKAYEKVAPIYEDRVRAKYGNDAAEIWADYVDIEKVAGDIEAEATSLLMKDGYDAVVYPEDPNPGVTRNYSPVAGIKGGWVNLLRDRTVPAEPVKRGRGRPPGSKNKQAGSVDEKLVKVLGAGAVGAIAGSYVADKHKGIGALAGAGMGILLFGGGKQAARFADDLYGASSTRIMNKSKAIHKRILTTERRILENTHKHIEQVEPFILALSKVPKETANVVSRALMTGRADVIDRLFKAIGSDELTAAYKGVRSTLDSLGDKLVNLKRFKRGNMEYFPRIVKDKEGLFKAIGKKESDNIKVALDQANAESIRKNGRPMSEIEESALINQMLFADKRGVQPGFSKNRGIEEITPELQEFYATPAESLHSYIRSAVQDIEAAEFFGGAVKNMKQGSNEFIDVDRSVKNLLADEIKSGALSTEDAHTISEILRARFKEGLRSEADLIRNFKNLGNIGLLGNVWSAATQLADVGVQVHVQGLKPTIESVVRQLTGKKLVDMRDFGLADNISQEFAGELRTGRWVRNVFKATLFAGADRFGKNTALNAAVIRAKHLVQTDGGVQKLANKYREAFGDDFSKLVSELKSGKISDLTRDYAFMELSRTQPVSRIEMPLAYLKHPNLRSYLWLKSFTMKQMDLVRRDAYNEIKAGRISKGVYNLAKIGVILGVSGATTDQIKDWMKGKDTDITWSDIPENMFKTFGFSEYTREDITGITKEEAAERRAAGEKWVRAKDATPVSSLASALFAPPWKMFDQLLNGDPKAIRYMVPGIGPYLAEKFKQSEQLKREAASE